MILTGTPLQNNLCELWALLHWLLPEVFSKGTDLRFKQSFDLDKGSIDMQGITKAAELLSLIMIRRTKNDVDLRLPPRNEIVLFAPLTESQRSVYRALITDADVLMDLTKDDPREASDTSAQPNHHGQTLWQRLNNLVMQLRKVSIHPYLVKGVQPDPYTYGDHCFLTSSKFIILRRLLLEKVVQDHKKIIVFSGFTGILNLAEELLHRIGGNGDEFTYVRFDGSTQRARRDLSMRKFQDLASNVRVILISTRSGGQGINLTAATEVVFLDEDWNPQVTIQAEARAHRIGQTNPVTIYKIHTYGTVEQQMLGRIRKKQYLAAKMDETRHVPGPNTESSVDALSVAQLRSMLRQGTLTLARPQADIDEMLQWDLKTIVARCGNHNLNSEAGMEEDNENDREHDDQTWLNGIEKVQTRLFEGQTHLRPKQKEDADPILELSRADRRVGKETTVMVDGFAVSKESVGCLDGEAVATLAGKDPSLATPKRPAKAVFGHQKHCQVCSGSKWQLTQCAACPRSFHARCADPNLTKMIMAGYMCSQHRCGVCSAKVTEAGGLLYACRDCPYAWCTDCLEEGHELLDDELPEFEAVDFFANDRTTYISCKGCGAAASASSAASTNEQSSGEAAVASTGGTSMTITGPTTPVQNRSKTFGTPQTLKRKLENLDMDDDVIFVKHRSRPKQRGRP